MFSGLVGVSEADRVKNLYVDYLRAQHKMRADMMQRWSRGDSSATMHEDIDIFLDFLLQQLDEEDSIRPIVVQHRNRRREEQGLSDRVIIGYECVRVGDIFTCVPPENFEIGMLTRWICEIIKLDKESESLTVKWLRPDGYVAEEDAGAPKHPDITKEYFESSEADVLMMWSLGTIVENNKNRFQKGEVVEDDLMLNSDGQRVRVPYDHVVVELLSESGEFQIHMFHANHLKISSFPEQMKWRHILEHPSPKG